MIEPNFETHHPIIVIAPDTTAWLTWIDRATGQPIPVQIFDPENREPVEGITYEMIHTRGPEYELAFLRYQEWKAQAHV